MLVLRNFVIVNEFGEGYETLCRECAEAREFRWRDGMTDEFAMACDECGESHYDDEE